MYGMKHIYGIMTLAALACTVTACSLEELPKTTADKKIIFGTEEGLQTYAYSFYKALPGLEDIPICEGTSTDYGAARSYTAFYQQDAYTAETSTSWSWTELRNINYFLDGLHSGDCTVAEPVRNHFEGLARWFRAYFYYDKLTVYGEVPWFEHCLSSDQTDEMYSGRSSRDVIIGHIIDDLDFAYANITTTGSTGNTLISKYAALALKSRVCLFEGTYRKYHHIDSEKYSAEKLLSLCASACEALMETKVYSLNQTTVSDDLMSSNSCGAYRSLFYSRDILTSEVILGKAASLANGVTGNANWRYTSASYGSGYCLSRAFVFTYLCTDGTRFTDKPDYTTIPFVNEFTNRDLRLKQTVKGPSYTMSGRSQEKVADIVNLVAPTGYHPIKFIEDSNSKNNTNKNENSLPIIRYAEVLLNYAEAKAELGSLDASIWTNTIGAIRKRAGITAAAAVSNLPTTVDRYLQSTFYPDIDDPIILEVRRERAIELVYEGFRVNDLNRWAEGPNFEKVPWTGIHIPALDTPVDINGDKVNDYYFSMKDESEVPQLQRSIYVRILPEGSSEQGLFADPNPAGGYDLRYELSLKRKWYGDDRQYLHPIPAQIVRDYAKRGYELTQNPGW